MSKKKDADIKAGDKLYFASPMLKACKLEVITLVVKKVTDFAADDPTRHMGPARRIEFEDNPAFTTLEMQTVMNAGNFGLFTDKEAADDYVRRINAACERAKKKYIDNQD